LMYLLCNVITEKQQSAVSRLEDGFSFYLWGIETRLVNHAIEYLITKLDKFR